MICKIYTFRLNENEGCIIVENEEGEMIASSGCEEGIPTLCTEFCQAWIENPLPEVEIWEIDVMDISNAYTEEFGYLFTPKIENEEEHYDSEDEETFEEWLVGNGLEITLPKSDLEKLEDQWNSMNHLYEIVCEESEDEDDEPNAPTYQQYQACENQLYRMVDKLRNQLSSPPQEITTFTDMYGNVYDSSEACEEGEKQITFQSVAKEIGFVSTLNPNTPANWIENALQEEIPVLHEKSSQQNLVEEITKGWEDFYLADLEKQARKDMKKHVLVKKANPQPRVDFSLLPNAASTIWSAILLFGQEVIDVNSDVYQNAVKVANNLDLYFQKMPNPKFATKASFEIEKILNK